MLRLLSRSMLLTTSLLLAGAALAQTPAPATSAPALPGAANPAPKGVADPNQVPHQPKSTAHPAAAPAASPSTLSLMHAAAPIGPDGKPVVFPKIAPAPHPPAVGVDYDTCAKRHLNDACEFKDNFGTIKGECVESNEALRCMPPMLKAPK